MKLDFPIEEHTYNWLLDKTVFKRNPRKPDSVRIAVALAICWLPLAIFTLIAGTFWTGNISTSFITSFDIQARFLITLPLFIVSEKKVADMLKLCLGQFVHSGIIQSEDHHKFEAYIKRRVRLLASKWTNLVILLVCLVTALIGLNLQSSYSSLISWQLIQDGTNSKLNTAGYWSMIVSRPFVMFFLLRWLFYILVWASLLSKIARLNLRLFPYHPDLVGGLGFLGSTIRFFGPIGLAISATIAGFLVNFVLFEGMHLNDFKILIISYFAFITFIFAFPLYTFTNILLKTKRHSIFFENNYMNGLFRELDVRLTKGYKAVKPEDLDANDYSAATDLSSLVSNSIKMKFIPITLQDLMPLWIMSAIPFLAVLLLEIPVNEILGILMKVAL